MSRKAGTKEKRHGRLKMSLAPCPRGEYLLFDNHAGAFVDSPRLERELSPGQARLETGE